VSTLSSGIRVATRSRRRSLFVTVLLKFLLPLVNILYQQPLPTSLHPNTGEEGAKNTQNVVHTTKLGNEVSDEAHHENRERSYEEPDVT
jgi:hypothetical protein